MEHDGYRCIAVDPPWPQKGGGPLKGGHAEGFIGTAGSRPMPYPTMTIDQIAALPVSRLAHPDGCHVYLWTTSGFLPEAYRVLEAWGFRYSTTLVWAKRPMGGGLGGAFGISTEFVLFGRRGRVPALSKVVGTWFSWKRPYDLRGKPMHSAKPGEFYAMAETVSPGPRLEMFARRERPGWDLWGDQAPDAVQLSPLDLARG
jgi:N6-adenosine-specific RNA methylase IME4